MANHRKPITFERTRRLAFQRHRAQCKYRNEGYAIEESYWNMIWTEERFLMRGMEAHQLCLIRRFQDQAWRPGNLALVTRRTQLDINNKTLHDKTFEHLYDEAIWSDYV